MLSLTVALFFPDNCYNFDAVAIALLSIAECIANMKTGRGGCEVNVVLSALFTDVLMRRKPDETLGTVITVYDFNKRLYKYD